MASWPRVLIIAALLNLTFAPSAVAQPDASAEQSGALATQRLGVVEQALRSAEPARSMQAAGGRARSFWPYGKTLHASVPVRPARSETDPPTAVSSAC